MSIEKNVSRGDWLLHYGMCTPSPTWAGWFGDWPNSNRTCEHLSLWDGLFFSLYYIRDIQIQMRREGRPNGKGVRFSPVVPRINPHTPSERWCARAHMQGQVAHLTTDRQGFIMLVVFQLIGGFDSYWSNILWYVTEDRIELMRDLSRVCGLYDRK